MSDQSLRDKLIRDHYEKEYGFEIPEIYMSFARAGYDAASAKLDAAVKALEDIARNRFGLQGLIEDGANWEDIQMYWANRAADMQKTARKALEQIKGDAQ